MGVHLHNTVFSETTRLDHNLEETEHGVHREGEVKNRLHSLFPITYFPDGSFVGQEVMRDLEVCSDLGILYF